jgi:hypothetical protein
MCHCLGVGFRGWRACVILEPDHSLYLGANRRGCVTECWFLVHMKRITILCQRDRRYRPRDSSSNKPARINRYLRRTIRDVPLCGFDCHLDIELAQVVTACGRRLMEACEFVDTGNRYTQRFCQLVSGLCRHMSISTVSRHLKLRWETVKNMDQFHLEKTLPALKRRRATQSTLRRENKVA